MRLVRVGAILVSAMSWVDRRRGAFPLGVIESRPKGRARTKPGGIIDMKFVLGLLTGLVLGAVGAVLYSVQSGRDLREAFEQVRSDLDRHDIDALGARLEARFTQMQAQLEEKIGQAREKATAAVDQASGAAKEGADRAAEAAKEGADRAAEAAKEGADLASEAAKDGTSRIAAAAEQAVEVATTPVETPGADAEPAG
jgi:gas vesicle protein